MELNNEVVTIIERKRTKRYVRIPEIFLRFIIGFCKFGSLFTDRLQRCNMCSAASGIDSPPYRRFPLFKSTFLQTAVTWRYLKWYSMRLCTKLHGLRLCETWGLLNHWGSFITISLSHSTLGYSSTFQLRKSEDICKYTEARGICVFAQRRRWLAPRALTLVRYLATLESEWATLDNAILICQIGMKSTLWIVSLLFQPCSEIHIDQHVQF